MKEGSHVVTARVQVIPLSCSTVSVSNLVISRDFQEWTGVYTLVVPSLSQKFIKNGQQNFPI